MTKQDSASALVEETTLAQPEATVRRDLRATLRDGVAFSVMVGAGETYVPAFALAAGLGEVTAGLVATPPMLALQLATPAGVAHLGSYRCRGSSLRRCFRSQPRPPTSRRTSRCGRRPCGPRRA